jgi:hypothetical protein
MEVTLIIWAIVSLIMVWEDRNEGKRAKSASEWMAKFAPRWYKMVTLLVMLPLFFGLLIYRYAAR